MFDHAIVDGDKAYSTNHGKDLHMNSVAIKSQKRPLFKLLLNQIGTGDDVGLENHINQSLKNTKSRRSDVLES